MLYHFLALVKVSRCFFLSGSPQEVSFMLPPLLGFLLDCAKKTDQSVVSISLGALVHLIEVGGHQFNDGDWDTLLKSIRYVICELIITTYFLFGPLSVLVQLCQKCIRYAICELAIFITLFCYLTPYLFLYNCKYQRCILRNTTS